MECKEKDCGGTIVESIYTYLPDVLPGEKRHRNALVCKECKRMYFENKDGEIKSFVDRKGNAYRLTGGEISC